MTRNLQQIEKIEHTEQVVKVQDLVIGTRLEQAEDKIRGHHPANKEVSAPQ